ncbi:MAG: alpha/beta hydrolase [Mobilitalea sp.]
MKDYTKMLPLHIEKYIGENDLYIEIFEGGGLTQVTEKRPPILLVHGAYTGSWMWSKYIPHFISKGWKCYAMNMRSHYKSRGMDMTQVSFEDYLEDIKEAITECGEIPIIIGFSLGGILCQKLAESVKLAGLILIDSCISKEVNKIAPYETISENTIGMIVPAPTRGEISSIDETENDIAFQIKYLSMESSKAFLACACWIKGIEGISVNRSLITCPSLVIKSLSSEGDDRRGRVEAEHLSAEYSGFWDTTHTGLLVGQRYIEVVDRIMDWL